MAVFRAVVVFRAAVVLRAVVLRAVRLRAPWSSAPWSSWPAPSRRRLPGGGLLRRRLARRGGLPRRRGLLRRCLARGRLLGGGLLGRRRLLRRCLLAPEPSWRRSSSPPPSSLLPLFSLRGFASVAAWCVGVRPEYEAGGERHVLRTAPVTTMRRRHPDPFDAGLHDVWLLHHRLGQLGLGHVLRWSPVSLHTRSSAHENASHTQRSSISPRRVASSCIGNMLNVAEFGIATRPLRTTLWRCGPCTGHCSGSASRRHRSRCATPMTTTRSRSPTSPPRASTTPAGCPSRSRGPTSPAADAAARQRCSTSGARAPSGRRLQWHLPMAVVVDGDIVGVQAMLAEQFAVLRTVSTGSWLGRRYQGKGIGTEMRRAMLHLAFAGLGAEHALSRAFIDNDASIGGHATARLRGGGTPSSSCDARLRRGCSASACRARAGSKLDATTSSSSSSTRASSCSARRDRRRRRRRRLPRRLGGGDASRLACGAIVRNDRVASSR